MNGSRFVRAATAAIFVLACAHAGPHEALARDDEPPAAAPPAADPKTEREQDLRRVQQSLQENEAERLRLRSEIEKLRGDRAKLNADLIDTSKRVRSAEDRMVSAGERLDALQGNEKALRRSLDSRRDVLVEVLAALQRIGRRPPPAVIIRPEDMLEAVRTSILMGAVLPELREQAQALANDLAQIVKLRAAILKERDTLAQEWLDSIADRQRLETLIEARQADLAAREKDFDAERAKATALSRQADTLKDLIAKMERDSNAAKKAAEEAAKAPKPAQNAAEIAALAGSAYRDPARLAPKIAFTDVRGALNLPVAGAITRPYGAADGFGGQERGITITTAPGALVTAPVDGWVAFSGPFRSYRNVLIINVGGGYHIVLIGMDRSTVEVGQFVLAGEPLGVMSSTGSAGGRSGESSIRPGLYVEFRKDGVPIDSSPWWAKSESEKARG